MLNYIKSEWYRIIHSSTMYVFTAILAGLAFALNAVLWLLNRIDPSFRYGTTAFSLSNLGSMLSLMFYMGVIIVGFLFAGERKSGGLKNTIAFGISREKIFAGKCIVSTGISVCSLIIILAVFMGSAVWLLEPGVEPEAVQITLKGVACLLLMAAASEVLILSLLTVFEKELMAYLVWYLIMEIIPKAFMLIGLKSSLFREIAAWMPCNYLSNEVVINMSGWNCLWETAEGAAKCLISGAIGLLLFLLLGLKLCKRQEV